MEQGATHPRPDTAGLADSFAETLSDDALAGYAPEDWLILVIFWTMTGLVFLQFFSRYVLNDSFAWTEELATYCLIGVVFLGSAMCLRKDRHIHVDLIYRFIPSRLARVLATLVDFLRLAFIGYVTYLVWNYIQLIGDEPMTTINWPKSLVYWMAFAGFVMMAVRAAQVMRRNWQNGYSVLERSEAHEGEGS